MAYTGGLKFEGPNTDNGQREWRYSTTDSLATVAASGYFNSANLLLRQNDVINVKATDFSNKYRVSSADYATTVTLVAFDAGAESDNLPLATKCISVVTDGGATQHYDIVVAAAFKVTDVKVLNKAAGTSSDTIKIQTASGAHDVTNAIDISGADKTIARVSTIDDAYNTFAVGDTIRVLETDGSGSDSPVVQVLIECTLVS